MLGDSISLIKTQYGTYMQASRVAPLPDGGDIVRVGR